MDIVLEVCDAYGLDYAYAYLFPAKNLAIDTFSNGVNKTVEAIGNAWTYEPASSYITTTPSVAAYMSSWPRDYIWRQFISLFSITWYVYPYNTVPPTN